MSRRAFLGGVLGTSALAVPLAANAGALGAGDSTGTHTVYWLNPDWGAHDPACVPNQGQSTCGGCYACVSHYQNKLFASAAEADANRAHPRCKCGVEAAFTVDDATYDALFGASTNVDRRTPGVNEILAASTTAPAPAAAGAPQASAATATTGALAFTGSRLAPLAAAGVGALAVGATLVRLGRREEQPASR